MDLIELSRRLENLIRFGTIHSIDYDAERVRVQTGGLVTNWLRWLEYRAGETTTWDPPTMFEQVVVLSPSGEAAGGVVLRGLHSDSIVPPSNSPDTHVVKYPDGAVISYDHAASHLDASGIQTARIEAAVSITLDTPMTHITGQCVIDDLLTYHNGLAGYGGSEGNNSVITGDIRHLNGLHEQTNVTQIGTGGEITSNGKTLHTHHHDFSGTGSVGDPT